MQPQASFAASLWRGHLLLFDSPPLPSPTSAQGTALLLIVLLLEGLLRPLLRLLARSLGIAANPWWLLALMCLLTLSAFGLALALAKLAPAALGLRPWREWSRTEKLYLLQIVPLATFVFSAVFADGVRAFLAHPRPGRFALLVLLPQLVWGFYQELVYRGMLQAELVRRLGTTAGIVTSNLLFTFGPLHAYLFSRAASEPRQLWIFAAIFGIGLFFAVLFKRSGNLWIIGTMHGLGDLFIDGLGQLPRAS